MAERRMFAKTIIDSDVFLDMPLSAQALYFHLSMRADDEGFINNHKKIQRMVGASEDDFKILIAKNFVINFESGVIVIKHWKIHNYIRADRLVETNYQEEKSLLEIKDNGAYTISEKLEELEDLSAKDKRKMAYLNSSLPYSFDYKIRRAFNGKECPVCKRIMTSSNKSLMPTIQHNIPISKGGVHELENISVICESCNTSIQDNETDSLNNSKVIEMWEKIAYAKKACIDWFQNPETLENIDVSQMSDKCQTNVSIGKDSIGKFSLDKESIEPSDTASTPTKEIKHKFGEYNHVKLTDTEYDKLKNDFGFEETKDAIKYLDEYIEMKGTKYTSHYMALRKWVFDAVKEKKKKNPRNDLSNQEYDFDELEKKLLAKKRI